jgi:hypothetical protein
MTTDQQRVEFMNKLAVEVRRANGVLLSEWESEFLATWLRQPGGRFFAPGGQPSQGRRQAADRMWMRYGPEINFPHPLDTVSEAAPIAEADPNGCQYLVREEGRQHRCNETATCREPGRLRYCDMHGEAVQKDCARSKIKFCLVQFTPHPVSGETPETTGGTPVPPT